MFESVLFYLFAGVAIAGSLLVIGQRNPMYSVLSLIASFGALSGLYVLLEAPFVAVIQVIIYAGAIMVLFLFVVMLLNAPREDTPEGERLLRLAGRSGARRFGAALAVLLVCELGWAISVATPVSEPLRGRQGVLPPSGSVAGLGRTLFSDYAFAFEVTSVLILVALIGAVVLAKARSPEPKGERP